MEKIKNLSLRKTIVLYTAVCLLAGFFLSAAVSNLAERVQENIWWKYTDQEIYFEEMDKAKVTGFYPKIQRTPNYDMTKTDNFISEACDFLQTWSVLIFSVLGSIFAVLWFYRDKIKVPLGELVKSSKAISINELDVPVAYENKDELGILCREFEKMRRELEANNRKMWRMVEQEKALRAAAAHDIRSPLAVLKGYQEMLLEFVPEDRLDKEHILKILTAGMGQIDRLEGFADTMGSLAGIEDRKIQYVSTTAGVLAGHIGESAEVMAKETQKHCTVETSCPGLEFYADCFLVMEVAENLLSNALRFAKSSVAVQVLVKKAFLEIRVRDDGSGFSEKTEILTKAYYHANPQDDRKHFGMGLYLCRAYCEKHGGRLLLENGEHGGGEARAFFQIKQDCEESGLSEN